MPPKRHTVLWFIWNLCESCDNAIPEHLPKTFVSNRVAQMQELTKEYQCVDISTKNNLTDLFSRGIDAKTPEDHKLWFQGPDSFNGLVDSEIKCNKKYLYELLAKESVCLTIVSSSLFDIIIDISNNLSEIDSYFKFSF